MSLLLHNAVAQKRSQVETFPINPDVLSSLLHYRFWILSKALYGWLDEIFFHGYVDWNVPISMSK